MGDPYRSYRPGRGEPRYEYPDPDYDYQPAYGRGSIPEPPYDRYGDPYTREPGYDTLPPAPRSGAPRGEYRTAPRGTDYRPPPPPIRAEPEYTRRSGRDYVAPPAPRGPVGDPYSNPAYYPPEERLRAPPPRETYERYPPEPTYRDDGSRYNRRRPRDEDYEPPPHGREYEYNYEPEPPGSTRRPPPPIEYRGGAAAPAYEPPRRHPRDSRETASGLPQSMPSQPSPESEDIEFKLPADGIRKEVLQKYITRFLGNDAVSRGPMKDEDQKLVYKYTAYRQFTTEQIRDIKRASELYEPGYARGDTRIREAPPGQVITTSSSRPSGRRNTDEDSMMNEPVIPRDEYVYTAGNQGTRAPAREIRAGRSPHDPPYSTSYHDPARHGRQPIEASTMRPGQDDDDEMED